MRSSQRALSSRRIGPYTLQAAIAAVHADAPSPAATDWGQIVGLYDVLSRVVPSPVVELNRAVAVAMRDGPAAGLELIDAILARGDLADYHLAHAARADCAGGWVERPRPGPPTSRHWPWHGRSQSGGFSRVGWLNWGKRKFFGPLSIWASAARLLSVNRTMGAQFPVETVENEHTFCSKT